MIFYGASGHAKVAIDAWQVSGGNVLAIIDDNPSINELMGLSVSSSKEILGSSKMPLILSVGSNTIRKKLASQLNHLFGNIVHPSAIVSKHARIGVGTVLFAGAIINADATIGKHCIVNTGAKIDHDCTIGDFVHIAPGATLCGGVEVGEGVLIGTGASVIPLKKVGAWSIVGAGAVVVEDVPPYSVVVGNPARIIRTLAHG